MNVRGFQSHLGHKQKTHEEPIESYYAVRSVPDKGYVWTFGEPRDQRHLGHGPFLLVAPDTRETKQYLPLESSPGLYEDFAAIDESPEGILAFANRFGWLGIGEDVSVSGLKGLRTGESLNRWRREIRSAKIACFVKDGLFDSESNAGRYAKALEKAIVWGKKPSEVYFDANVSPVTVTPGFKGDLGDLRIIIATKDQKQRVEYARWERQKLVETVRAPALLLAAEIINEQVAKHCSPRIMIDGKGKAIAHTVPHNLLGVIWMQLFQIFTNTVRVRRCTICMKEMNVTDNSRAKRSHDTCSNRVRQQRFRERNRENA